MKLSAAFSMAGVLLLAACAPQNTETREAAPQQQPVGTSPVQDENAEVSGGEKPSEFDRNITDPKIAAGEEVYERSCAGCHDSGTGGAPKPGNKEEWAPRIALGVDVLIKKSIEGFDGKHGAMPPKGGNEELSTEEVSNAVQYMVARSK